MKNLVILLSLIVNSSFAVELGEIEVQATKTNTKNTFLTNSYYHEGQEIIKNSSYTYVLDQIRRIPGIYVKQAGGPLGSSTISMRGMPARHVLVLIDGVPANDPAGIDGASDLSLTNLENVESIEVLKGSQSVLYGGEAMAGVILITTKSVKEKKGSIIAGGGNQDNTYLGLGYNYFKGDFVVNVFTYEDRFSGVSKAKGDNFEKDLSVNEGSDILARYKINSKTNYALNIKLNRATYDLDKAAFIDDDNFVGQNNRSLVSNKFFHKHNKKLQSEFSINNLYLKRNTNDRNATTEREFIGHRTNVEYLVRYKEKRKILVAGISYEKEDAENILNSNETLNETMNEKSVYSRFEKHNDNYFYNLGARLDNNSSFGTFNALNIGIGDFKNNTKRFANLGTGIKFPSLYQLYTPGAGNSDLLPEKSVVLDVGVERIYLKAVYGVVLFANQITGSMNFVGTRYVNQGDYQSSGFEYYVKKEINNNFSMGFNYNSTYVTDSESGDVPFIPEHKLNYNVSYKREKHSVDLNFDFIGTHFIAPAPSTVEQKSYSLLNLAYGYEFNQNNNIALTVNNIFNKDYQQINGYSTLGMNAFVKYRLYY
jgi:vitamin B12 transporter